MKVIKDSIFWLAIGLVLFIQTASAQTSAFTYQGSLINGGSPANGSFDFEIVLFDGLTGGSELFSNIVPGVTVTNGVFSLPLNFGSATFPGANRFLEIRVRAAGGGAYTVLNPRQPINSSPYSIKSLLAENTNNAFSLGGIASSQYVLTNDIRLSNPRNPLPDSPNYIQNSSFGQPASNFSISGTGTAGILNAGQYNIGGSLVLTTLGANNLFLGISAGQANTNGVGIGNTFVGNSAGLANTGGSSNSFFGASSGVSNTTGGNNTAIGNNANFNSSNLTNATAIGAGALVAQSDSLVLGNNSVNVGIGTSSPNFKLDVVGRSRFRQKSGSVGAADTAGFWFYQNTPNQDRAFVGMETDNSVGFFGTNGGGWGLVMNTQTGRTSVTQLGAAGATPLCRNASNEISTCSSSARYKENINTFTSGLDLIRRLRPVSFNWKDGGMLDMGLVAEEVNALEPLLTTINAKGEVEGVKYDRVGVVLINAVKEQQAQIETQTAQIEAQQVVIDQLKKKVAEFDELKAFICGQNPGVQVCKP